MRFNYLHNNIRPLAEIARSAPSPAPSPAPASQPASHDDTPKIAVLGFNSFQKRALLWVRKWGPRACRANQTGGFWHPFRTNATPTRVQNSSSDRPKIVHSCTPSGPMQHRHASKTRSPTDLKVFILASLPDQCNTDTRSKLVLRPA